MPMLKRRLRFVIVIMVMALLCIAFAILLHRSGETLLQRAFLAHDKEALAALCDGTKQSKELLEQGLRDSNAAIRAGCIRILAKHYELSCDRITPLLQDDSIAVRVAAVEALAVAAAHGDKAAEEAIRQAMQDPAAAVRAAALRALHVDESATELLKTALGDKNAQVRLVAAEALVLQGNKSGIPVLIELLSERTVARAAFAVLHRATGLTFNWDKERTQEGRAAAQQRWRRWWRRHGRYFSLKTK